MRCFCWWAVEENYITQKAVHRAPRRWASESPEQGRFPRLACGGGTSGLRRRTSLMCAGSVHASCANRVGALWPFPVRLLKNEHKRVRAFERVVSLPATGEVERHPWSPRPGQRRVGGRTSPRDPLLLPEVRAARSAPLAPQGPVMAAAWMDPAQVSGRCFGHCCCAAGGERAPGRAGGQQRHGVALCSCVLSSTSAAGLALYRVGRPYKRMEP